VDPENIAVRPTGGGGVLHENDLCFSLLIPWKRDLSRARDWPSFYESLHRILADFLPFAGISPSLLTICPDKSDRMTGTSLRSGLCFYDPVRGDVMMEGRKILGGALAIGRNGVLYQGSLCVSGKDPVILSSFFEKWYCAEGRVALEKALVEDRPELAGRGRGSFETFDTL
jgi:lipoate-protein ligase A